MSRGTATRDLASIMAEVVVEHAPKTRSPEETLTWLLRTWPECTEEQANRALSIAIECVVSDFMVPAV